MKRNIILEKKIKVQQAKNILKLLRGIEILALYSNDENIALHTCFLTCTPLMYSNHTLPHSQLSITVSEPMIVSWIIIEMQLKNEQEYFFLCHAIWAKIKLTNVQLAVKSLWQHNKITQNKKTGTVGFLLINSDLNCMMEVSCDSRDEENYLLDIWEVPS